MGDKVVFTSDFQDNGDFEVKYGEITEITLGENDFIYSIQYPGEEPEYIYERNLKHAT